MIGGMEPDWTGVRGRILHAEPLARYTSWRVGGPADRLFVPADDTDLSLFLSRLPDSEPLYWMGLGSNILVRDGGVRGTVIIVAGVLSELRIDAQNVLLVGAGVACAKAARFVADNGLAGIEFLAGIPGTIGGALAMNAGAHGAEIWQRVLGVTIMNRHGRCAEHPAAEFRTGYRSVELSAGSWFVRARLQLEPDPGGAATSRIRDYLALRTRHQPTGKFSCGSVFKNPPGHFAGRLIEESGLKGLRVGQASVSEKHANFIINEGGASAADIEALIGLVQDAVSRKFFINLEPEVRLIGDSVEH